MKKIKIGDIFEIPTKNGWAYMQYIKAPKNKSEIEKVRIFYTVYEKRPKEISDVLSSDYFFLSFVLGRALRLNIINNVGNYSIPETLEYPRFFRTEHLFKENWWQIVDSKTSHRKSVEKLSQEQKKLSPWGTWNDTLLKENLENGWTLDKWI